MSRSRIAVFSGFVPFNGQYLRNPRGSSSGGPFGRRSYGAPLGRRAYYVPAREESMTDSRRPYRKAYTVKAKRNTPAMKKAQARFKRVARICKRKSKNGRKGAFQRCMAVGLRKKGKR